MKKTYMRNVKNFQRLRHIVNMKCHLLIPNVLDPISLLRHTQYKSQQYCMLQFSLRMHRMSDHLKRWEKPACANLCQKFKHFKLSTGNKPE